MNGECVTWKKVYWDFIKVDQPLAWNYHQALIKHNQWSLTDGDPTTEPAMPSVCHPKPKPEWAIRVIKNTFNVGMKRVGKDVCPVHSTLKAEITRLQTLYDDNAENGSDFKDKIQQYKDYITEHEQRANAAYDIVHWSKLNCGKDVYQRNGWQIRPNIKYLSNPQRSIHVEFDYDHVEFDYDHDRFEFDINEQDAHYKSKVVTHGVSIVHKPVGRLSFLWSELHGGHDSGGIFTCLHKVFKKYSLGAVIVFSRVMELQLWLINN